MKLALRPILNGPAFTIHALVLNGTCETQEFFTKAELDDADELASLVALLERSSKHGPPRNKEKSRDVGGDFFEFKTNSLRVCYFYDKGRMIICTHGFGKPQKKVQNREIKHALELRKLYFNLKEQSPIPIEKPQP